VQLVWCVVCRRHDALLVLSLAVVLLARLLAVELLAEAELLVDLPESLIVAVQYASSSSDLLESSIAAVQCASSSSDLLELLTLADPCVRLSLLLELA